MKTIRCLIADAALAATSLTAAPAPDARCFELRVYYAAPGKLDALNARFRDHTCKLFETHGMQNLGYWLPLDNPSNKLVYLLAFPSREARDQSWKNFGTDPAWKEVVKTSEANGRLVPKVESTLLAATDFSPVFKPNLAAEPRVFELRTYQATPGKLPNLLARFRDHTLKLFEKYGMTSIGYWTPTDKKQGADEKLVYLLAHKSKEACAESFKNFRADPEWIKVKADSETAAGGSLTVTNGVQSVLMAPTDYSQTK
jgi:hypothetical protein